MLELPPLDNTIPGLDNEPTGHPGLTWLDRIGFTRQTRKHPGMLLEDGTRLSESIFIQQCLAWKEKQNAQKKNAPASRRRTRPDPGTDLEPATNNDTRTKSTRTREAEKEEIFSAFD